jgi:hypothetical protein
MMKNMASNPLSRDRQGADRRRPLAYARGSYHRAFTITELLVAIAVLVVVIIGTSKIFGTASQVTGLGQANQDLLQAATAIERQLRADIARLTHDGFFAIHNVAVSNDVNGAVLLNPNLPADVIIRADQLVFFATGVESSQSYKLASGSNHKGQSTVARLYYGPAFQLPRASGYGAVAPGTAHDADAQAANPMTPWRSGTVGMANTTVVIGGGTNNFSRSASAAINGTQPNCLQWLLVRQPVALCDDDLQNNNDNSKTVYFGDVVTARSIWMDVPLQQPPAYGWSREIRNGRVDCAATLPNEIRRWITFSGANVRPWSGTFAPAQGGNQRNVISSAVYYPRAEREAPSMHRVDQALTNSVISEACSSFIVDWTYEGSDVQRVDANGNIKGGVGEVLDALGNVVDPTPATPNSGDEFSGVIISRAGEQPWFGLADASRGVFPYGSLPTSGTGPLRAASTIMPLGAFPNNVESESAAGPFNGTFVSDYWALFGYNQDRPLDATGNPHVDLGYTPWPSAIRITMVLHDPAGRLEAGREFQFVIDLPRRQ